MLAQAQDTAPIIGYWMIGALAFLQVATLGMQLLRYVQAKAEKREIHPQPLEVRGSIEFTPRKLFDDLSVQNAREHENLFSKLGGVERGIRAEMKKDNDGLHEKVNAVAREVSGQGATLEAQNQYLAQMNAKLDRLVERRPQ